MSSLLPIVFASPWVLVALGVLPALYWLLRTTPPRPAEVTFPPLRLLLSLRNTEETPRHTPWWLILLRMVLAALIIIAMAGPVWKPLEITQPKQGPLWLVVDNGWDAAPHWDRQQKLADLMLKDAMQHDRTVLLITTADGPAQPLVHESAAEAADRMRALTPRSWQPNREELVSPLEELAQTSPPGAILWLASPLEQQSTDRFSTSLMQIAQGAQLDDSAVLVYQSDEPVYALKDLANSAGEMSATLLRTPHATPETLMVQAFDQKQRLIAQTSVDVQPDETQARITFELPSELRNDIAQIKLAGQASAATTLLVDDSWRRRKVGLYAGGFANRAQPLLSSLYYLEKALAPFADLPSAKSADLTEASADFFSKGISVLVLADVGALPPQAEEQISEWVTRGGTLIRFASPLLSEEKDSLFPVRLRGGDRKIGGSLSWKEPQALASFAPDSPFRSIQLPEDVVVNRQVLAEPTADLPDRTWASLQDGTPLVTARTFGDGQLILFHVTPDTQWSNLALSGGFVDMLRAIINTSATAQPQAGDEDTDTPSTTLPLLRLLEGDGKLVLPTISVQPIDIRAFTQGLTASRTTPPGLYGAEDAVQALNVMGNSDTLLPLDLSNLEGATVLPYPSEKPMDLRGPLFIAALLLALLDTFAVLWLAGKFRRSAIVQSALFILAASIVTSAFDPAQAQTSDEQFALNATLETRLAYVLTGNAEVDQISQAGLNGLTRLLSSRTALEPAAPVGVNVNTNELAFFPILYWPIAADMRMPGPDAMAKVADYMRNGGTILFDTRDAYARSGTNAQNKRLLQDLLEGLDIPALEPVPADHVLTKTFYILEGFPGRYDESPLWVQATAPSTDGRRPVRAGDGVTPIMITGNDLAGAWAIDDTGTYLFPTVPSGANQRELAARVGINILMYTMTGNYKADQVHIPALLDRIGQ